MAAALFVVEIWLATTLWTALVVGWYARRRGWKVGLAFLATLLALVPWVFGLVVLAAFHLPNPLHSVGFNLALWSFLTLLLAVFLVWWFGLQRIPDLTVARGTEWPLGRLAMSAGVALILAQTTLWMFDSQLRQQLIDLRREAQVLAQSVSPRPVPDDENAAPLYREAMNALATDYIRPDDWGKQIEEDKKLPGGLDSVPEEPGVPDFCTRYWLAARDAVIQADCTPYDFASPRLKTLLERHRGIRGILVRGSRVPVCDFGRDFTRASYEMLLPEVQAIRAVVYYLAIDARQAAATGDGHRAAEDLETIYRVSNHVAQEPFLVSIMVAIATEGVANQTLAEIVNGAADPPAEVLAMSFPPRTPYLNVLERGLRLEEATGMMAIAQMSTDLEPFRRLRQLSQMEQLRTVLYEAPLLRAFFLSATADDLRNTYYSLRSGISRITRKIEFDKLNDFDAKEHTPLVSLVFPAVGACTKAALRGEARRRLTETAAALFHYYHSAGAEGAPRKKLPATLNDLLPDYIAYLPSDPFTAGQPLHYRVTNEGFLLYSIGSNFADDGGIQKKDDPDGPDIVFEGRLPAEIPAKPEDGK